MADCITNNDLKYAIGQESPDAVENQSLNTAGDDTTKSANAETTASLAQEGTAHGEASAALNDALPEPSAAAEDIKVSTDARSAANRFMSLAAQGMGVAKDRMQRAFDYLDRSSELGRVSYLNRLSQWLTEKLVRHTAKMENFFLIHAGEAGKNSGSNKGVRDVRAVPGKLAGQMMFFERYYLTPFIDQLTPVAEKLGFANSREFARQVGLWQMMRHMPERNEHLITSKRAQVAELRQKDRLTPDEQKLVARLEGEANEVEQARNMLDPVDEKGRRYLTGGKSDAEAHKWMEDFLDRYNISREQMDEFGDQLSEMCERITSWRAENGFMDLDNAQRMPVFEHYVPVRTLGEESMGIMSDATVYNPGNLHQMEGVRTGDLVDAFSSIFRYMNRAATEYATRDLGLDLYAMAQSDSSAKSAIRVDNYNTIVGRASSTDPAFASRARALLEGKSGFAMTVQVPETDANTGQVNLVRKLITFDPTWVDPLTGLTGRQLAQSMVKVQSDAVVRSVGRFTGMLASMNTHWNPMFAPVNMLRDSGERVNAMMGQSYMLEDGRLVDGDHFIPAFIGNIAPAGSFLMKVMRGKITMDDLDSSPIGRHFKEYITTGAKQEFDATQLGKYRERDVLTAEGLEADEQAIAKALTKEVPGIERALNTLKPAKGAITAVNKIFDNWNEYFNNIAAFAQFHTLRSHGVRLESAREGTIEIMNLRESGTATDAMRMIYAFAKPTMQGAVSLLRSVGLAPNARGEFKANLKGIGFLGAQILAFSALKSAIAGTMGESEYDKLTLEEKARFIPIPLSDGGVYKLALPFGMTPIAAMIANAGDMMMRGKMDPEDAVAHILSTTLRAVHPADFPSFSFSTDPAGWFMQLITPASVMPLERVRSNKSAFGSPITWAQNDGVTAMHLQGDVKTPSGWHTLARSISQLTGGRLDMAPEQWRTIIEGYCGGVFKVFSDAVSANSDIRGNFDESTRGELGPWLSALGVNMLYKKLPSTHAGEFYDEYNRLKAKIRRSGIDIKDSSKYGGDTEKRIAYQKKMIRNANIMSEEDIDRYFKFEALANEKRKLSRKLRENLQDNKTLDDENFHERARELYQEWLYETELLYMQGLDL